MTTKAEGIAQGSPNRAVLGLVEGQVDARVKGWVVGKMIDGRRNDAFTDGFDGSDGFHSTGRSQQVTGHGLGRRNIESIGILPKDILDGFDFG